MSNSTMNRATQHRDRVPCARDDAGFTLVEVAILLSVLVVISAMITPVLSSTLAEARLTAARTEIAVISQALRQFLDDIGCEIVPQNDSGTYRRADVVQAPRLAPPVAPPAAGSGTTTTGERFIAAAASDPCSATNICDSEPVEILVTAGDIPAVGPNGDEYWVRPPDGFDVDYLEFFLIANNPGNDPDRAFPSPDDCSAIPALDSVRAWQGAYVSVGAGDPWGNRYMVNALYLPSGDLEDVVVLSAGPDEEVDSEFAQDGFVPGDDDVAQVFTKG
jgi:type II secretory pathway pseudopilin PulG